MTHDEGAVGEEFERSHDLCAGDRMTPHHLPFLVGERARFPQNALGHRDLAQVVEQTRMALVIFWVDWTDLIRR